MSVKQVWLQPQKAPGMCGQEPLLHSRLNYKLIDFSHIYGSFLEQKCFPYANEVDLYTCTGLGCLETAFLIVFDMLLTVFDTFLTDRQTDQ